MFCSRHYRQALLFTTFPKGYFKAAVCETLLVLMFRSRHDRQALLFTTFPKSYFKSACAKHYYSLCFVQGTIAKPYYLQRFPKATLSQRVQNIIIPCVLFKARSPNLYISNVFVPLNAPRKKKPQRRNKARNNRVIKNIGH